LVTQPDPVLIVDDHEDTRRLLEELLELEGFRVEAASTGHEALLKACDISPCLILLDLGLPDIAGVELVRELRRQGAARTPIYALSGYPHLYVEAMTAGCDGFLLKPILPGELREVMHSHCATAPSPQVQVA
jgi:two-component system KDP operon response regulator KdpE